MTQPSGSVQTRRIQYNNSLIPSEVTYNDATYGIGLDPVARFNPRVRLSNYAAPLTEQVSNSAPTGTPLYWWKADNGLTTLHTPTVEHDRVLSWANSGLATSGTMTPIMTGMYQSPVNTYPVAKFDPLNGRIYVQKEFATGTGGMVLQMPYTDTFSNFTAHIAFRANTPIYLILADFATIPYSYPFAVQLSDSGLSYVNTRGTDGTSRQAFQLLSDRNWHVVSVVYNDTTQRQTYWLDNAVVQQHSSYNGAGYPTNNTFSFREVRSWYALMGSAVGEIVIDNHAQTTGTVLDWHHYLLAKFNT